MPHHESYFGNVHLSQSFFSLRNQRVYILREHPVLWEGVIRNSALDQCFLNGSVHVSLLLAHQNQILVLRPAGVVILHV
jgi:hypothetical protein